MSPANGNQSTTSGAKANVNQSTRMSPLSASSNGETLQNQKSPNYKDKETANGITSEGGLALMNTKGNSNMDRQNSREASNGDRLSNGGTLICGEPSIAAPNLRNGDPDSRSVDLEVENIDPDSRSVDTETARTDTSSINGEIPSVETTPRKDHTKSDMDIAISMLSGVNEISDPGNVPDTP